MEGKELGEYRIVRELAEGGMGLVFEGLHLTKQTPVAIKTLRKEFTSKREDVARFIREATIYKRLIHPNLIRFYAFGFDAEMGFYLVTELLLGRDLEEALSDLRNQAMPLQKSLDIALQICAGLLLAHQEGIVHRDLKPGNIFLLKTDDGEQAKVFDFGIAKVFESDRQVRLTQEGGALGTPLYMAPEQIRGDDQQMGPGVDIYALGVIIFQMVTGRPPFTGASPMTILMDHIRTAPPLLRKYQRSLGGTDLERLIQQMMAKEVADRPRSLEEVKERLWTARHSLNPGWDSGTIMDLPNFSELQELITSYDTVEQEKPIATLQMQREGKEKEIAWLLPGERLSVGSARSNDVRLRENGVAAEHAEFYCAPAGWITVKQLHKAIVRVNGAPATHTTLRHGDWITLGEAELKLHCF